jgi:hypothetical protein
MMAERGISVTHTTIMRWIQRYVPEFEKRWNRFALSSFRSYRASVCLGMLRSLIDASEASGYVAAGMFCLKGSFG